MSRPLITAVLACVLLAACGATEPADPPSVEGITPLPAPKLYRSSDKSLTFPTPAGAFYCPKPEGWVGSDHGTVVFLTKPKACVSSDAFTSSERGALSAPNIQVYYGYDPGWEGRPPRCEEIGRAPFLGGERPLCLTRRDDRIVEVVAKANYMAEGVGADIKANAVFTLVTDAARLDADLATFRTLLAQTSTCNQADGEGAAPSRNGRPPCAPEAVWF